MTAVVAYSNGNKVWMAGDSFCGTDDKKNTCVTPKVYVVGNMCVGICGSIRQELVLQRFLTSFKQDFDEEWLLLDFPTLLRDEFERCKAIQDQQLTLDNSVYMFGLNGKIFNMENDFGVWQQSKSYSAIGVGEAYVLGAMAILTKKPGKDIPVMLQQALETAVEWSSKVLPPYTFASV